MSNKPDFKLDIYTWPAVMGSPTELRTSKHPTASEAIAHLDSQTTPYAYAVLQRRCREGWEPCDWDGNPVENFPWPRRTGTNGNHPAYTAMHNDWSLMIEIVDERHTQGRLVEVAGAVLRERHPVICGWAEQLAFDVVKHRMIAENEWLTPAQIERELNLKRGVVRKYLHDHPELYERELARRADGRTVQIKRGVAINRWGQK